MWESCLPLGSWTHCGASLCSDGLMGRTVWERQNKMCWDEAGWHMCSRVVLRRQTQIAWGSAYTLRKAGFCSPPPPIKGGHGRTSSWNGQASPSKAECSYHGAVSKGTIGLSLHPMVSGAQLCLTSRPLSLAQQCNPR